MGLVLSRLRGRRERRAARRAAPAASPDTNAAATTPATNGTTPSAQDAVVQADVRSTPQLQFFRRKSKDQNSKPAAEAAANQPPPAGSSRGVIHNPVNLKKETLHVTAASDNPRETGFNLSFRFDASAPCSVTVFVCAHEDVTASCRITSSSQPPPQRYHYKAGLQQPFPNPSLPAGSHVLRASDEDFDKLFSTADHSWPLIIRIETLNKKGQEAGKSLNDLPPGAALPDWVQAQTTYAVLWQHTLSSGQVDYGVDVKKQTIWVDGRSHTLLEVYGRSAGKKSMDDDDMCIVCFSEPRDTTVLPCRHTCLCGGCARELLNNNRKCPICRDTIDQVLQIHMQRANSTAAK